MNNIAKMRKAASLTQTELAKAAGTELTQIGKLERGERNLSERWLERISKALDCTVAELLGEDLIKDAVSVPVVGFVQAGIWQEALEITDLKPIPTRDKGYQNMFALQVRGNSYDKVLPDGSNVICVTLEDYSKDLKNGDTVVAHRIMNGVYEATLKEYEQRPDGTFRLRPRSTDPRYQKAIDVPVAWDEADQDSGVWVHAVAVDGQVSLD